MQDALIEISRNSFNLDEKVVVAKDDASVRLTILA
jgi:hypothetical protein